MLSTILQNASIIDGSGRARYVTDVGLAADRIALVGDLHQRDAHVRIDCSGQILCPGFIDVHSHSDELWLALPRCDGKIAQGVTTEIGGNCGMSAAPLEAIALRKMQHCARQYGLEVDWRSFDEFFSSVEQNGVALNVASLVGLGTTRSLIAGESERRLESDEIDAQARLVRGACEQGALGVSSGLIYPPSQYADETELIAMSVAARESGAPMYASHVRNEGDTLLEAIEEALTVGAGADVSVQCSHHKAQGKKNWGKVHRSLEMIDRARSRGMRVHADVYPYVASWTELATILPDDVRYGGTQATLQRLRDPKTATAIALNLSLRSTSDWHDILITSAGSQRNEGLAGMRMDEIAQRWGIGAPAAAIRLLQEEELDVEAAFFTMSEDDVATVLSADFMCVGSDASARALTGPTARGVPHPRTFGTFPRIFGRFVRGRGTLDTEAAVKRMTSTPARAFGLTGRGLIEPGHFADLVVFDESAICDTATYERPFALPLGIGHVFVNGRAVISAGEFTDARPGRVLRNGR
ncbi:MAG: D-aminoacylase [Candidatus Eremiobacteraeota bacterium]|nr:D-aminoacylase [Candidatus Eremiobacteraeota bacterium]